MKVALYQSDYVHFSYLFFKFVNFFRIAETICKAKDIALVRIGPGE